MSDQVYGKVDSDLDPFKKIVEKIPGSEVISNGKNGVILTSC